MKTLSGSFLNFFTSHQREKKRVVWCSREIAFRLENGFLVRQKRAIDGFSLALPLRPKCFCFVSVASEAQANIESEEIKSIASDHPKTVHVRFKLHKECAFGQQFILVGDDPVLGLWDPSNGVPLNWSEGHVWTAEMDIHSDKVIKYKFILIGNTGTISWQPGADRILETWDTEKTISVSEDWDNPEIQSIVEEELVADLNEESSIDSDLLMAAEDLNQPVVEEGSNLIKELDNVDDSTSSSDKPSATMVAAYISEELGEQDLSSSDKEPGLISVADEEWEEITPENNGKMLNGSSLSILNDQTSLVLDEGASVLVPGLVPMAPEEVEEEVGKVQDKTDGNSTTDYEEIGDSTEPEFKDEQVSASLNSTETSEMMFDEKQKPHVRKTITQLKDGYVSAKQELYGKEEQLESNIMESDMQWGRRTLQKFLAKLGFI